MAGDGHWNQGGNHAIALMNEQAGKEMEIRRVKGLATDGSSGIKLTMAGSLINEGTEDDEQ